MENMEDSPMMKGMTSMAEPNGLGESVTAKKEKRYPSMRMNMANKPGMKDMKLGQKGLFLMQGRVRGLQEYGNGEKFMDMDVTHADMVEEVKGGGDEK